MIFLRHDEALKIPGLYLSPRPQHHADSKGKPEERIIGDFSGQHDPYLLMTKISFVQIGVIPYSANSNKILKSCDIIPGILCLVGPKMDIIRSFNNRLVANNTLFATTHPSKIVVNKSDFAAIASAGMTKSVFHDIT